MTSGFNFGYGFFVRKDAENFRIKMNLIINEEIAMNKFAIAFRKARLNSDKTFRQIKEHIGLSIGYLSDIENGKRNPPDISVVKQVEDFFGITDNHLVILAKKERITNPTAIGHLINSRPEYTPKIQEVLFRIDALSDEKINEKLDYILEELRKQVEGEDDPWLYRNLESLKFLNEERYLAL